METTEVVTLVRRRDGQVADENGVVRYPSVAAVRAAYDIPETEELSWPVGHALRFPR